MSIKKFVVLVEQRQMYADNHLYTTREFKGHYFYTGCCNPKKYIFDEMVEALKFYGNYEPSLPFRQSACYHKDRLLYEAVTMWKVRFDDKASDDEIEELEFPDSMGLLYSKFSPSEV